MSEKTSPARSRLKKLAVAAAVLAAAWFLISGPLFIKNPWVQEYVPGQGNILGAVPTEQYESVSPDFAIGATAEGVAVFKNPRRAFRTVKRLYAKDIFRIAWEYHLPPLTQLTYDIYGVYGSAAQSAENGLFVSCFMGIYENSFTDLGWATYVSPTDLQAIE